jgi:hypothetical protein
MNVTTIKYVSDPVLEYKIGRTTDLFEQHQFVDNAEKVTCRATALSEFDVKSCIEQVNEFKRIISSKYKIEKPLNFYAIIRTATSKVQLLESLSQIPDFFKDRNISDSNKIIRLGNVKNVVFYYCPVFVDLMKYHVDVGVKFGRQIIIPNFRTDGLAFTLEFNRKFTKDYRADTSLDYSKKKLSEKTTEVMKKPLHFEMTAEAREINKKKPNEETTKIIGEPGSGFDTTKLKGQDPYDPFSHFPYNITENFVPIYCLPINEQNRLKENLNKNLEIDLPKPSFISSKGTNDVSLTDKLRNEYKKIEENDDLLKQVRTEFEKADTVTLRSEKPVGEYTTGVDCSPSITSCDYDTKVRAFENVGKYRNLPNSFIAAVKGFYKKDAGELDKIRNFSDDAILTYKLGKILDYSAAFKENNVYSKQECENLETFRTSYVKHHFLYENDIPFILIDKDEVNFNFYGNTVTDNQHVQDKLYFSLRSLVVDLKEKVKNNILFVKKIPTEEYVNKLTPSWRNRNEFIIKCYLLPKNKF